MIESDRPVPSPSQTLGPFFAFALPFPDDANAVSPEAAGALQIEGRLLDGEGAPAPDGLLEIWHEDQFARSRTDAEGVFHFTVVKPRPGPGPTGTTAAPHFTVYVFARGLLRQLVTRIYFPDEEAANATDWVLGRVEPERRATLIARPEGNVLHFDVHLQGDAETVFFAL